MSSRRASTKPHIFGMKKSTPSNISPKTLVSASGFLDTKSSFVGRGDRVNTIDVYTSNSPNRLKDISNSVVNSSIDTKQDMNTSKFSFIKMLTEKKSKDITENHEHQKLREEVTFLRQEVENKDKTIERLSKENEKLHKEMQELQATVELAKGKITCRLQEYSKKTQDLEAEIKALRQENQSYRDQTYKVCEYPSLQSMIIAEEQADLYESDDSHRIAEHEEQFVEQAAENPSLTKLQLTLSGPVQQNRTLEGRKNSVSSPNPSQSKMKRLAVKSPDIMSPNTVKGITTPLRKVPLLGNLEKLNPETYGIVQRTISTNNCQEETGLSISVEHSWAGNLLNTNLSAFRKSPKAAISPVLKSKKLIKSGNENELKCKCPI